VSEYNGGKNGAEIENIEDEIKIGNEQM